MLKHWSLCGKSTVQVANTGDFPFVQLGSSSPVTHCDIQYLLFAEDYIKDRFLYENVQAYIMRNG